MKRQIIFICFGIIIALLMINLVSATINISACGVKINSSGNYQLINNITNFTSQYGCIDILTNNVTLDGQGFMINMSEGYAITSYNGTISFNINNIIVKNLLLYSNSSSYNGMNFINSTNNTIIDNITIMNNSLGDGIVFSQNSYNITISNIYRYLKSNNNAIQFTATIFNNVTIKDSNFITDTGFGSNGLIKIGNGATTLSNIKIQNNNFTSKTNGFIIKFIDACSNCTISGNRFISNASTYSLINFNMVGNNLNLSIYNNLLYGNDTNKYFVITNSTNAILNITNQSGTNIAGGNRIGGNFYYQSNGQGISQTCPDVNDDFFCDNTISFNFGNITDYLPLASLLALTGTNYSTETLEGSNETYLFIVDYNNKTITNITATFYYNNTIYAPLSYTKNATHFTFIKSILVPLINESAQKINYSIYLVFNYTDGTNYSLANSTISNQTIHKMDFDVGSCTGNYPYTFLDTTYYNEESGVVAGVSTTTKWDTISWNPDSPQWIRYKSINYGGTASAKLCYHWANTNYNFFTKTNYSIVTKTNYTDRHYNFCLNIKGENASAINQYLLFSNATYQKFYFNVKDSKSQNMPNAVVEISKKQVPSQFLSSVLTDSYGNTIERLLPEEPYIIRIYGTSCEVLKTLELNLNCPSLPCTYDITLTNLTNPYETIEELNGLAYSITYSNTTGLITTAWQTTTVPLDEVIARTNYRSVSGGDVEICSSSSTSNDSYLTCNVSNYTTGTFVSYIDIKPTGQNTFERWKTFTLNNILTSIKSDALLWTALIVVTLFFAGIWNPVVAIGLAVVGLLLVAVLGFVVLSWLFFVFIGIIAIILIIKLRS